MVFASFDFDESQNWCSDGVSFSIFLMRGYSCSLDYFKLCEKPFYNIENCALSGS